MIGRVITPPIWKIFPLGWNSSTGPTQLIDWGFLTVRSARFNFLRLWTQISGGLRHWFTMVAGVPSTGLAPSCLPMRITGCTMLILVGSMWFRTTMVDYGSGKKVSTGSGPPVHPLPFLDAFSRRLALSTPYGTGPTNLLGLRSKRSPSPTLVFCFAGIV